MNKEVDNELVWYNYYSIDVLEEYENRCLSPAGEKVGTAWRDAALKLISENAYQAVYIKTDKDGKKEKYDWKSAFPFKPYFDLEVRQDAEKKGFRYVGSYCNVEYYDSLSASDPVYNYDKTIDSSLSKYFSSSGIGATRIDVFQNNLLTGIQGDEPNLQYFSDPKTAYLAARSEGLYLFTVSAGLNHVAGVDIISRFSNYDGPETIQAGSANGIYKLSDAYTVYGANWNNTYSIPPDQKAGNDIDQWVNDKHVFFFAFKPIRTEYPWEKYMKK